MPTIGIYVGMPVARAIAARWKMEVSDEDFHEVVRSLCAEALDDAAGIVHPEQEFRAECGGAHLHKRGRRCRFCGGSR
jgi:hypothetical protein